MSDVQAVLESKLVTINEASWESKKSAVAIRYRINKGEIAAHFAMVCCSLTLRKFGRL
jgi:hypothetical protein